MGNRDFRPILTAFILLWLCGPAAANNGTTAPPVVEYLDSQPLSLAAKDSEAAVTMPLRNGSSTPAAYHFDALLKDRYDQDVAVSISGGDGVLDALKERFVTLKVKVTGKGVPPYSGFLLLRSGANAQAMGASKPRTLVIRGPAESFWSLTVVLGGLGISIVTVLITWFWFAKGTRWGEEMGQPNWDYSRSWATNLTAISGVLGTVLTGLALAEQPVLAPKQTYTVLNVLFVFLVAIAPFLYSTIRRPGPPSTGSTDPTYRGLVGMFLLACMVTLWGVFGQLGTISLIFTEMYCAGFLSCRELGIIQAILLVVFLGFIGYSITSIPLTIDYQRDQIAAASAPRVGKEDVPTPSPARWALL